MDKAQFIEMIQNIGTCEDDAQRRTMLTDLQDDVTQIFDTNEKLTNDNETMRGDITRLQNDNMKLFLKVTADDKEPDDGPKEPKEKRKFEDLFNDKGGLK